jgi:hypothetical protein
MSSQSNRTELIAMRDKTDEQLEEILSAMPYCSAVCREALKEWQRRQLKTIRQPVEPIQADECPY